mmetsp:Transcript_61411/g.68782  ORF Transcript_61411/g.68782 Transcript_61411/m.68782 type:complete len:137 (-) Transcript_61411:121-531(-)
MLPPRRPHPRNRRLKLLLPATVAVPVAARVAARVAQQLLPSLAVATRAVADQKRAVASHYKPRKKRHENHLSRNNSLSLHCIIQYATHDTHKHAHKHAHTSITYHSLSLSLLTLIMNTYERSRPQTRYNLMNNKGR